MELSLVNKLSVQVCVYPHFKCSKCTKLMFSLFFFFFFNMVMPEMFVQHRRTECTAFQGVTAVKDNKHQMLFLACVKNSSV